MFEIKILKNNYGEIHFCPERGGLITQIIIGGKKYFTLMKTLFMMMGKTLDNEFL